MIERVLVPTDGSALSERILGPVVALLGAKPAAVKLVRVIDDFAYDDGLLRGIDPTTEARAQLEPTLARLGGAGARGSAEVLVGDPADRILKLATGWNPSLIAMATHGRSGADLWIRGSVAQRVLRRARHPLLLANPRANGTPSFKKILVALDGSDASARILPLVTEVARASRAEVVLFHAIETGGGLPSTASADGEVAAREMLEQRRDALAGVNARARTGKGPAAFAILNAAKEEEADLVALTTHGRTGAARWVFGSVAENVVNQCRTPLLVLRTVTTEESR